MHSIKQYEFYYRLRSLPYVHEIWLFGSRSKGTSLERSDIDLAILCPEATNDEWQVIRNIIDSADTLLKIDCLRLDQLKDSALKADIEKTKTILFKRIKNNYDWYELFLDLGEALEKFQDAAQMNKDTHPYLTEATIQIFEYTFELYWKMLKKICYQEGIEVQSPRATFQQAFALKLIDDEMIWLKMMENRNLTSHTYKRTTANIIYDECKTYLPVMVKTYALLQQKYHL